MHEILRHLPAGARVLDLGSASGSFAPELYPGLRVVRLDLEEQGETCASTGWFVQADAARLPFPGESFAAIVSNHSLEHIADLPSALAEMGRVLQRGAAVYLAAPDAGTVCDRLYRWLASGGGHVNAFRLPEDVAKPVAAATGLPLQAVRTLHASLSYLHPANRPAGPAPRKLWLLAGGGPRFLFAWNGIARRLDRWFGTRVSVYGWAFYFGSIGEPVRTEPLAYVCLRCGSGHARGNLRIERRFPFGEWTCPDCGARNPG